MIEFCLIAEAGKLSAQATLLCESLRRFGGAYKNAPIRVISPRAQRRPSERTVCALKDLNVDYLELDVQSAAPEYGPSYRVHTAALIERQSSADTLVFLDSDMLFLAEPDLNLDGVAASARPVDLKGMCTTGPGDEFDSYWRSLCNVCGVDYDAIPPLTTTVDRRLVKASYNGGFFVARRSAGIFQHTAEFFAQSVAADLRPYAGRGITVNAGHGHVVGVGAEYWGSSQACLSLAVWGRRFSLRMLPATHNVPAHIDSYISEHQIGEPLVALHYHYLFSGDQSANPLLTGQLNIPAECRAWLTARLPI